MLLLTPCCFSVACAAAWLLMCCMCLMMPEQHRVCRQLITCTGKQIDGVGRVRQSVVSV